MIFICCFFFIVRGEMIYFLGDIIKKLSIVCSYKILRSVGFNGMRCEKGMEVIYLNVVV